MSPFISPPFYFPGADRPNQWLAQEVLDAVSQGKSVMFPNGFADTTDIRMAYELAGKSQWNLSSFDPGDGDYAPGMKTILEYYDALLFRGWLRPERSGLESKHGSRADAQVHTDTGTLDCELIDRDLTEAVNCGIVNDLLVLNFGEDARGAVYAESAPIENDSVDIYKTLVNTLLANKETGTAVAKKIDIDGILDSLNVPVEQKQRGALADEIAAETPQGSNGTATVGKMLPLGGFDQDQARDAHGRWTVGGEPGMTTYQKGEVPRGLQGAQPTRFQAATPEDLAVPNPDFSKKFPKSLDNLTLNNLQQLKDEAYNRYIYYKVRTDNEHDPEYTPNPDPIDVQFYADLRDRWQEEFEEVDAKLDEAQKPVTKINEFVKKANGKIVYGSPPSPHGGAIKTKDYEDPYAHPETYTITRPIGTRLWDAASSAIIGHGGPGGPDNLEVGESDGYIPPQKMRPGTSRQPINPEAAKDEATAGKAEGVAAAAVPVANALDELLNGLNEVTVRTWTIGDAHGIYVIDPRTGKQLSWADGGQILHDWAGVDNIPQ